MKTQNKFFTPASAFNKKFDMKQPFLRVHVTSAQSQHILLFFFVALDFHFCGEKTHERINITNYVPVFSVSLSGLL